MSIELSAKVNTSATYDNNYVELQRGNTEFSLKNLGTTVTMTHTLNADSGVWNGYNLRQSIPASEISTSCKFFTLRLSAGAAEAFTFTSIYIGHAGTAPSFDGTQVQVLFSGVAGATVSAGSTLASDIIVYSINEAAELIISVYCSSTNDTTRIDNGGATGYTLYYKLGSDESATTSVSGYTTAANRLDLVDRITLVPYATDGQTVVPGFLSDSGSNSTVWDMSALDINENLAGETGTVKYQYSCDNGVRSYNGSWLTLAQLQAESDPTGRYMAIKQQLNSNGTTQDASFADSTFVATLAATGVGGNNFRGGFING